MFMCVFVCVPNVIPDYQRLEFLGDAVLGWLVTAHLYFASSTFTPAELTIIKVRYSSTVQHCRIKTLYYRIRVRYSTLLPNEGKVQDIIAGSS